MFPVAPPNMLIMESGLGMNFLTKRRGVRKKNEAH